MLKGDSPDYECSFHAFFALLCSDMLFSFAKLCSSAPLQVVFDSFHNKQGYPLCSFFVILWFGLGGLSDGVVLSVVV